MSFFFFCIQDISVSEETSADQTDLSASPPLPFIRPPPLSLSDITAHEPQEELSNADVTKNLTNPVDEGEGLEGSTGFEFDEKDKEVEDLSRATTEKITQRDQYLEREECNVNRGMSNST